MAEAMRGTLRRLALAIAAALLLAALLVAAAGEFLSRPAARIIGNAPPELPAESVRLPVSNAGFVSGWFARGKPGMGGVLLLHGVRGDRTQMQGRARFLQAAGYAVLLIDLPAHGESPGDRITFGAREAAGVIAALGFLRRQLPAERIGVIGISLGAASLVLSKPHPAPDAVVLEAMYPNIAEAVKNRLSMRLGTLGAKLAPLLLWQLPLILNISESLLRPETEIAALKAPLLLASGTLDKHTHWAETERIYAAAHEPKELWPVVGAAHVDLHAYDSQAYEARILAFLDRYLRR